jgi:hypothetical protein
MFGDAVDFLMKVKDEMGSIGEDYTIFGIDSLVFEVVQFVEEGGQMDDDSVADDAGGFFVEYAGG